MKHSADDRASLLRDRLDRLAAPNGTGVRFRARELPFAGHPSIGSAWVMCILRKAA